MSVAAASTPPAYRHEALLWHGIEDFVSAALPFVRDGLAAGEPVMVALTDRTWLPLQDALGEDADAVLHIDMTELGRNPARILAVWLDFVAGHSATGTRMRGLGEPVWPGRRSAELSECVLHEAMLNLAVPQDTPLWLVCPYEVAALDPEVVDAAGRTHPTLTVVPEGAVAADYAGTAHARELARTALPAPLHPQESLPFATGDLADVRALVSRRAGGVGLERRRTESLVLAVNELAANSIDHGGGSGVVTVWEDAESLVFEVQDQGRLADLLVGRLTPTPEQPRGRGLWLVNRLSDLVQLRSGPEGTTVRITTWL